MPKLPAEGSSDSGFLLHQTGSDDIMLADGTDLDSLGWEALRKALNQRVVASRPKLLPSRVNRVWLVETDVRPVIVKRSLSGRCEIEFETLLQAKVAGMDVPYPLAKEGDYLVTEFIPGESCDVLLNRMFDHRTAEGMGHWLGLFHHRLAFEGRSRIMADAVPSNFVMNDGRVFGFDLEDSTYGDPMDDVGKLAASILGSEPYFTPIKFDLCLRMLRSYGNATGKDVLESSRPFISRHLKTDARQKPLFRRTIVKAAKAIEKGWPELA
jgi:tRNA A-37 threonylcarbamoyl transferase component Bud32